MVHYSEMLLVLNGYIKGEMTHDSKENAYYFMQGEIRFSRVEIIEIIFIKKKN